MNFTFVLAKRGGGEAKISSLHCRIYYRYCLPVLSTLILKYQFPPRLSSPRTTFFPSPLMNSWNSFVFPLLFIYILLLFY